MKVVKLLLVTLLSLASFDLYTAHAEFEEPVTQGSPHTQVLKKGTPPLGSLPVKSALKLTSSPILVTHQHGDAIDDYEKDDFEGAGINMRVNTPANYNKSDVVNNYNAEINKTPNKTTPSRVQFKDQQFKVKAEDPSAMNDLLALNPSREELSQNEPAQAGNKGGISFDPLTNQPVKVTSKSSLKPLGDGVSFKDLNAKGPQGQSSGEGSRVSDKSNKPLFGEDDNSNVNLINHGLQDVNAIGNNGHAALHEAAKKGDDQLVKSLLDQGADVNIKGSEDQGTALHWATANGHSQTAQTLINTPGVDVDAVTGRNGDTALMFAAKKGDVATVQALLNKNANVNIPNKAGKTALQIAAENGHSDVVESLLNVDGIEVNTTSLSGDTPLHRSPNRDITQMLLKKGADPTIKDANEQVPNLHKNMSDRASDAWNAFTKPMRDAWASFKNLFKSETKEAVQKDVNDLATLEQNIKNELAAKEKAFKANLAKSGDISATALAKKSSRTDDEQTLVSHVDQTIKDFETLRNLKEAHNQIVKNPQRSGSDADIKSDAQSMDDISQVLQDDLVDIAMRAELLNDQAILTQVQTAMGDKFDEITKLASDKIAENEKAAKQKADLESQGIFPPSSPAPTQLPVRPAYYQDKTKDYSFPSQPQAKVEQSNEEIVPVESKDDESRPKYAPPAPPKTAQLVYDAAPPIPGNAPQGDASPQFVQNEITPSLTKSRVASEDNADAFNDLLKLQPESVQSAIRRDSQGRPLGPDGKILLPPAPPSSPMLKPAPPALALAMSENIQADAPKQNPRVLLRDLSKAIQNGAKLKPVESASPNPIENQDAVQPAPPAEVPVSSSVRPPAPPRTAAYGYKGDQDENQDVARPKPPVQPVARVEAPSLALAMPEKIQADEDLNQIVSPTGVAQRPASPLLFTPADLQGKAGSLKTTQQQAPKPTLLNQLKQNQKENLKKVDTTQPKPQEVIDTTTLAGALKAKLAERNTAIAGKSDEIDKQIDEEEDDTGIEGIDSSPAVVAPKPVPSTPVSSVPSSRSTSPVVQRSVSPSAIPDGVSSRSTSPTKSFKDLIAENAKRVNKPKVDLPEKVETLTPPVKSSAESTRGFNTDLLNKVPPTTVVSNADTADDDNDWSYSN